MQVLYLFNPRTLKKKTQATQVKTVKINKTKVPSGWSSVLLRHTHAVSSPTQHAVGSLYLQNHPSHLPLSSYSTDNYSLGMSNPSPVPCLQLPVFTVQLPQESVSADSFLLSTRLPGTRLPRAAFRWSWGVFLS